MIDTVMRHPDSSATRDLLPWVPVVQSADSQLSALQGWPQVERSDLGPKQVERH